MPLLHVPPPSKRPANVVQILARLPDEVVAKFYGCGAPLPLGIDGLHVLDLGSGSGRDCYVCAALIGPNGSVTGIDMTAEQNEVSCSSAAALLDSVARVAGEAANSVDISSDRW